MIEKDAIKAGLKWDNHRCDQMKQMQDLIFEVSCINSGNHCLERIRKCIDIADELRKYDRNSGKKNFHDFLADLAIEERSKFLTGQKND